MTNLLTFRMAIKWRLIAVMADREVDNQRLHELTGLHLGTIAKLRNNPPSRLDTDTLNKLCKALQCQPGDLLRYVPDENDNQGAIEEQKEASSQKLLEPQQRCRKQLRSKAILKVIPRRRTA